MVLPLPKREGAERQPLAKCQREGEEDSNGQREEIAFPSCFQSPGVFNTALALISYLTFAPNATGGTKTCLDFLPPVFLLLFPLFLLVTDRYSNRKCGIWPGDVFSLSCLRITHHLPSSTSPPPLTCSPPSSSSFVLTFVRSARSESETRARASLWDGGRDSR